MSPVPPNSLSGSNGSNRSHGDDGDRSTRDRLLGAAAEVFCEKGYEGTTVALVARRAGLSTGAIYANFRDKADLLLRTIERGAEQVIADMETARQAGVSAANRLLLMARRMITDPDPTQRLLMVEMLHAGRRDPDVERQVGQALGAMEHEIGRLIDRAKVDGDLDRGWDTATVARFCTALGIGYTNLKTAGLDDPDPRRWVELTRRLVWSLGPTVHDLEEGTDGEDAGRRP